MAASPVHVAVSGFSWTSALVGLLNLIVGGAFVAWIKLRPKMRELETTSEEKLRAELMGRIERVEAQLEKEREARSAERAVLEEKIERQRQAYEHRMEAERLRHEAEYGRMRHRANNADACLDSFVMLLEAEDALSAKAMRALTSIKDMRDRQRVADADERAAVMQVKLATAPAVAAAATPPTA